MPHTEERRVRFRPLTVVLIVIGLILIVIGIVYFAVPAKSLPTFFPGHVTGMKGRRTKHGIAAIVLGVLVWIGAWFTTAPSRAHA
jgi:uncharacterized membrane protein